MNCPLCSHVENSLYFKDDKNDWIYYRCDHCSLTFRDPKSYLSSSDEIKRYQTHNNSIENEGYVSFLKPVVDKLSPYLKEGDRGLDYGCGPGPILDILFKEKGHDVLNYDPFFYFNPECLSQPFDFITCTEAFEHFYNPKQEIEIMSRLLRKKSFLLIMTEFCPSVIDFKDWYYRKDPTHVVFLNQKSLEWVAKKWEYEIVFSNQSRISLLQKKS